MFDRQIPQAHLKAYFSLRCFSVKSSCLQEHSEYTKVLLLCRSCSVQPQSDLLVTEQLPCTGRGTGLTKGHHSGDNEDKWDILSNSFFFFSLFSAYICRLEQITYTLL